MSNRPVKTPDTCYISKPTKDGYGDSTVTTQNEVKCAFFQQFSQEQAGNEELTQSDAYAYLDRDNAFIKEQGFQLHGFYFKINSYGVDQWYIITTVQVAPRKLLTNEVNNVQVGLQVAAKPLGAE